jgi:hypothetical protein
MLIIFFGAVGKILCHIEFLDDRKVDHKMEILQPVETFSWGFILSTRIRRSIINNYLPVRPTYCPSYMSKKCYSMSFAIPFVDIVNHTLRIPNLLPALINPIPVACYFTTPPPSAVYFLLHKNCATLRLLLLQSSVCRCNTTQRRRSRPTFSHNNHSFEVVDSSMDSRVPSLLWYCQSAGEVRNWSRTIKRRRSAPNLHQK